MSAFCIVEESDGADWLLHEVYPTFDDAEQAAEKWKTRDRSHGGKPYTWVRIIEQEGADELRVWRFDDWTQVWVVEKDARAQTRRDNLFDATAFDAAGGGPVIDSIVVHHHAETAPETGAAFRRRDRLAEEHGR